MDARLEFTTAAAEFRRDVAGGRKLTGAGVSMGKERDGNIRSPDLNETATDAPTASVSAAYAIVAAIDGRQESKYRRNTFAASRLG